MKELTKAEEQVMQILWRIEKGFVKEIREYFSSPKPAYNTVSTIVRILEKKGFVKHTAYGKSHQYYPVVSKNEYSRVHLRGFVQNYFSNSFKKLVSFFSKEQDLSVEELEEMRRLIDKEIANKKQSQ